MSVTIARATRVLAAAASLFRASSLMEQAPPRLDSRVLADRARGAFYGALIADALSMPVHWYYNPADIDRDFGGRVTTFHAPKPRHPSSIMTLSNTGGAGRGSQQGTIIGDVINHGKKHLWGVANQHYHVGMKAGENTLNAVVLRLLARTLSADADLPRALASRPYSPSAFLGAYIAFMRTPGSHNDTYAETWHRMFFSNLVAGRSPEECADDDGHNIDSAGGLVLLSLPSLLAAASAAGANPARDALAAAADAAVAQQMATHKSPRLARFSRVYASALARVFLSPEGDSAASLRSAATEAAKALGADVAALASANSGPAGDRSVVGGGGAFTSACYIEGSLPALLYFATKYAAAPAEALISNTNVGGENCHRGAALGALVGAAHGMSAWEGSPWVSTLADAPAIAIEADAFAAAVVAAFEEGGA